MKLSQPSSPEVAVAGHICLDLIPALLGETAVIPGKLLAVGPAVTSTGGAVSNTGLALHRLGFRTRLLGKVGDDLFGKSILAIVGQYGKELADGMIVSAGEHSSYTVVVSPPGADRCFWHYSGTNDTFGEDDLAPESLQGLRLFHLGYPTLMKRLYRNEGRELEQLLRRVKEQGITVSLDLAEPDPSSEAARQDWRAILARALPYTDVFLPSFEELLFLLRREQFMEMKRQYGHDLLPHVETELLRELTAELLGGGAAVAGVKLGPGGLYLRTTEEAARLSPARMGAAAPADPSSWRGRELLAPCFQVPVKGTTGAGDCTIAGFLGGMLKGLSLEDALLRAVAVGACNVEETDALSGIPPWERVNERLAGAWPQLPSVIRLEGWRYQQELLLYRSPLDAGQGKDLK